MNKTTKKNIIVLLATLIFTLAFATTCFAKSSPTATVIPTTTVKPTTKAPITVKPTKNNETTKKKQKTTKKDETTTGSGKTGKRNPSDISPKTGSNIIIPIAGLLVATGAIVVSRKELTDKN